MNNVIFHLAFPIGDILIAKQYYADKLGAKVGRENNQAIIFNFYGHQLVGHTTNDELIPPKNIYPRHFGLIFTEKADFDKFLTHSQNQNIDFYQPLKLRFKGQQTEHQTFFLQDPFYNIIEFKYYSHYEAIFGANQVTCIGDR